MRVLLVILAVAWFGTLGVRPLYQADETRYAEIPREMVASGDWTGILLVLNVGNRLFGPPAGTFAAALIASIEPKPPAGAPVYAVDIYDHSLPWYLRRPVTMVAYRDELGVAIDWEKDKFIADVATFERAWAGQKEAYAFVGAGAFKALAARVPVREIARDVRYAFVARP